MAKEGGLADGVLSDEPGGFGTVGTNQLFGGPSGPGYDFPEPRSIRHVNSFHARMIRAAQLIALQQFFSDLKVLCAHGQKLAAECFIEHEKRVSQESRRKNGLRKNHRFLALRITGKLEEEAKGRER
jgi:hypothetical protein